jgi:hypothetical protein
MALVVAPKGGPTQLNAVRGGPETEWVIVVGKNASLDEAVRKGPTEGAARTAQCDGGGTGAESKAIVSASDKRQGECFSYRLLLVWVGGAAGFEKVRSSFTAELLLTGASPWRDKRHPQIRPHRDAVSSTGSRYPHICT